MRKIVVKKPVNLLGGIRAEIYIDRIKRLFMGAHEVPNTIDE